MSSQSRAFKSQAFKGQASKNQAFDRSDGFGGDDDSHARRSAGRKLELVSRSDFVDSSAWETLPNAVDAVAEADRSSESSWSAAFTWIMEGFLLYGASLHPNSAFPIALLPAERDIPQPAEVSPSRGFSSVGLHAESSGKAAPRAGQGTGRNIFGAGGVAAAGVVRRSARQPRRFIADVWTNWRREREIRRAVSALEQFDDRTLRDMGIPSRSKIENVVRYCRDC
jgi:uncharacterized protein YjiS (DUF1127 family)